MGPAERRKSGPLGDKTGPFCGKTAVGGRKFLGVLRQQKLSRTLQICKQWSWFSIFFAPAALPGTLGADSKPSQPPTHRPVDRIRHSVLRRYYRYSIGTPKDVVLIILYYFILLLNSMPRSPIVHVQGTTNPSVMRALESQKTLDLVPDILTTLAALLRYTFRSSVQKCKI